MILSFSTNAFSAYSVTEAIDSIAAIGYRAAEILADQPHLFCLEIGKETLAKLKRVIANNGLLISNLNANTVCGYYNRSFWEPMFEPSLANPDSAARKWRIAYTKECIKAASVLESPNVSITSGRLVPGSMVTESIARLKDSVAEVLDYAAKFGVRVGIEYEPGLLIENCHELEKFLASLNSPWLGANLDIGHSCVAGEDPAAVIKSLGAKIFHVHLEDIKDRKHCHLVPGDGDIDFENILSALDSQSYLGYVTVELYSYPHMPEDAAIRAFAYLKQFSCWH